MSRPWAKKAGLSVGSLLLFLLIAEGLFRWYLASDSEGPQDDGEWRTRYRRMNETLYQRSDDPLLVYEPRSGSSVEMEYGTAGFNSAGMRDDREFSRQRTEKRRVALLGDSLVWSEFLSLDDSLGRSVGGALGSEYETLTFGVTGYDTGQEVRWYEKAVRPFEPQVVVLVYCMNDMMIMSGPYNRYANSEEQRLKEEQDRLLDRLAPVRRETLDAVSRREEEAATSLVFARLRTILRRATFDANYVDEYTVMADQPARVEATRTALVELGAALERDSARGVLVISPVLESWDNNHWSHIHQLIGDAGREAGFVVVDPLEQWRREHSPTRLRIPGDNLHYSPRGSRVLGRTIAGVVQGLDWSGPVTGTVIGRD